MLSNSRYHAIMREYDRIQAQKRHEQEERIKEIYKKIPRIEKLSRTPGRLALAKYREIMEKGDASVLHHLSKDIDGIRQEKEELLIKNGFPKDYMDLQYECPICKDTGMVESKRCSCFKAKLLSSLYQQSNIAAILQKENFDTFDITIYDNEKILPEFGMTQRQYMEKVVAYCKKYAKEFKTENKSLLLMGKTGVGKSFLSHAIAKEVLDSYHSVVYLSALELFDIIAKSKFERFYDFDEEEEYAKEQNAWIEECDLLVIDDLGTELTNAFTISQFFHIINRRLEGNQATIISTNLAMSDIRDIYSERVSSRLGGSQYENIYLYGEDIRMR